MTTLVLALLAVLALVLVLAYGARQRDNAAATVEPNLQPVKPKESVYRRPDSALYTQEPVKDGGTQGADQKPARKDKSMLKAILTLLLTIPSALMGGLVFSKMWGWFFVRLFPGAPHIGVMDAVGLLMVLGFPLMSLAVRDAKEEIKKKHPDISDEGHAIAWSVVMTLLVYPLCLFFAWLWHLAIG